MTLKKKKPENEDPLSLSRDECKAGIRKALPLANFAGGILTGNRGHCVKRPNNDCEGDHSKHGNNVVYFCLEVF